MHTRRSYKERGIVLHTVKYGESGMVAYLLTRGRGRMSYMIDGVRSGKGRGNKVALFQPMFTVEFEGIEMSGAQMHRMRDLRAAAPLHNVVFDARKSAVALFMAETLYRLVREVAPDERLFDFLWEAVAALDAMECGAANFHLWFLVRLSAFLGFYPGNEYIEGGWFDIAEGLFVRHAPSHRLALAPQNASILAVMMKCQAGELHAVALSGDRRSEFLGDMLAYLGYHFDQTHSIRSVEILREVF
jgi:DNA repair protein RecO (recombination protein O)